MKFHHICMRVPEWDSFRERVRQKGYPVVLDGGGDLLKFLYIDARDVVGHYLECVDDAGALDADGRQVT